MMETQNFLQEFYQRFGKDGPMLYLERYVLLSTGEVVDIREKGFHVEYIGAGKFLDHTFYMGETMPLPQYAYSPEHSGYIIETMKSIPRRN